MTLLLGAVASGVAGGHGSSAVRFDNSADIYSSTAAATGVSATTFTMAGWIYRVTSANDATVFGIQRASPDDYFILMVNNSEIPQLWTDTGNFAIASSTISLNSWVYVAGNFGTPSGTARLYVGRTGDATLLTASGTGHTAPNALASIRIGGDTFGQPFDGRVAGVKMWNAVLSAAELEAERFAYSPVRTADLYAWYPFDNGPSTVDASGNGHTLTAGGTLTTEAGPPYTS